MAKKLQERFTFDEELMKDLLKKTYPANEDYRNVLDDALHLYKQIVAESKKGRMILSSNSEGKEITKISTDATKMLYDKYHSSGD